MQNAKTQSLKSYHAMIAALAALGVLAVFFINNWSDMISWLPIAIAIFFDGKKEKADEMAKLNISRANTVAMWLLFAAFAGFGMYTKAHTITAAQIVVVICSVLAVRSILFLIFDRVPVSGE